MLHIKDEYIRAHLLQGAFGLEKAGVDIRDIKFAQYLLEFEKSKFLDDQNRYAVKVLKEYGGDFVKRGMELVKGRA